MRFLKKYWDIFGGIGIGVGLAYITHFQLETIQICYSVIILILVSIGVLRIIKQSVDKSRDKQTLIDQMVDSQKAVKAISIAQDPIKDGEMLGKKIIKLWEGLKGIMKKLQEWFDKFKGIILAIALGVLTIVEGFGGFINQLCGGTLTVYGIDVVPLVTLIASVVVGIISNGFTKEQNATIKALFSKSDKDADIDAVVLAEIKKTMKENEAKVKEFNAVLKAKNTELDSLNVELEAKQTTLYAKREMSAMTPQLATAEDVHFAEIAVNDMVAKIDETKRGIVEVETSIANLTSTITALKSQL